MSNGLLLMAQPLRCIGSAKATVRGRVVAPVETPFPLAFDPRVQVAPPPVEFAANVIRLGDAERAPFGLVAQRLGQNADVGPCLFARQLVEAERGSARPKQAGFEREFGSEVEIDRIASRADHLGPKRVRKRTDRVIW